MATLTLQTLGRKLLEARGDRGIREVATEVGVSSATLSRVERGYMPDLETFGKICRWLQIDPGEILGVKRKAAGGVPTASVQFRKDETLPPRTAQALAQMILATQRALMLAETTEERG
jgi:transcriptional regulator with XRE-family HTH domain